MSALAEFRRMPTSGAASGRPETVPEAPATQSAVQTAVQSVIQSVIQSLEVSLCSLEDVEREWRQLEATGVLTPYQRFDWIAAYAAHVLPLEDATLGLVAARGPDGALAVLFPFAVRRKRGLTLVSFVGGKHANFHMPAFSRNALAHMGEAEARALLDQASLALGGVDAFIFVNQPTEWDGLHNPFAALSAQPSPSLAYKLSLQADADATLNQSMSAHARKKHKNKRARFAEMGASRLLIAGTDAERDTVLETFFRQKSLRFRELGIADPFADETVRSFIRAGSKPAAPGVEPVLTLAGLELNGAVIATYIGTTAQGRFSGMATSFEADPALIKVSPGDILLVDLIRHHCRLGFKVFDVGVGEARYKSTFCDGMDALHDGFIAISAKGRLAASALRLAQTIKAKAKASLRITAMVAAARRAIRLRVTPRPSAAAQ